LALGKLLTLLFVLALTARSLVPAGFMLAPSQPSGGLTVVLCFGHKPASSAAHHNHDSGSHHAHSPHSGDEPAPSEPVEPDLSLCSFGGSAHLALLSDAPLPIAAAIGRMLTHRAIPGSIFAKRHKATAPARAPPAFT